MDKTHRIERTPEGARTGFLNSPRCAVIEVGAATNDTAGLGQPLLALSLLCPDCKGDEAHSIGFILMDREAVASFMGLMTEVTTHIWGKPQ